MHEWLLAHTFFNLPAYQWVTAGFLTLVYFFLILSIWKLVILKLKDFSAKTLNRIDDVIIEVLQATQKWIFALFALLLGIRFLALPERWLDRLDHVTFIVLGLQIAIWISKGITLWASGTLITRDGEVPNPVITAMLSWIFKAVVWSVLLLTVLANVGVNITAFVASLGIGGVAVALAVQNILSDLFASLSIGLDKPFVIGDFIIFGDVMGTVERVGLKTTHIRSLNGEQVICSNTELLKNTIRNYKRMSQRRVAFTFGVSYATDPDQLEQIPTMIKSYIQKVEKARFDRAHFKGFTSTTLEFEVVYFLDTDDFNLYMDVQQALNLALMRELKTMGVEFALPGISLVGLHPIPKETIK
ncbi:MAG: mechanosensitive ion channel protein MscS [Methylotenera sp.]|nr:MAG: mechanosensitive ion channel protein MscS [Methylotenera sp.]